MFTLSVVERTNVLVSHYLQSIEKKQIPTICIIARYRVVWKEKKTAPSEKLKMPSTDSVKQEKTIHFFTLRNCHFHAVKKI
jgi:ABC-type multidrug transport system ATPase subunit